MKRFTLVLFVIAALGTAATAQTTVSISDFQSAVATFAADMASVLDANSTTGNVWSSAYVGGFPKFGVGLSVGANFIPADSLTAFEDLGIAIPAELKQYGIPIPAAVASLKIGLPFLPIDVGVKGGLIPDAASGALSGMGVDLTYHTLGVNVRYAILKDKLLIPAVSVGASWNYVKGSAKAGLGTGGYDYTYGTYTIAVTDPDMALEWESNTFDFTLQVSKDLLIFTPYAGAGLTVGKSTVKAGMSAATLVSGGTVEEIEAATGLEIDDQGFLETAESTTPVFRVYGGTSINIVFFRLDMMACYVPSAESFGAQVMARVQL